MFFTPESDSNEQFHSRKQQPLDTSGDVTFRGDTEESESVNPKNSVHASGFDPFASLSRTLTRIIFFGIGTVAAGLIAVVVFVSVGSRAPENFPLNERVEIAEGSSTGIIADQLALAHVIRSPFLFKVYAVLSGADEQIIAGDYSFENALSLGEVMNRITSGDHGNVEYRVVLYEGWTREQMALELSKYIDDFSEEEFLTLSEGKEGYLFPDTYFFFRTASEEDIIDSLERNFNRKVAELQSAFDASARTFEDIITMASIIEREASGDDDRFVISGILWNRIDRGMLMQVDAPFVYLLGKGSAQLTRADLAIDSPYNTYKYKGLPPTPIGAPSLDSIEAALMPAETDYLFYLHGLDGEVRYATTHDGHVSNKQRYLR